MKKTFVIAALTLLSCSNSFAAACLVDAEKAKSNELGYAVGTDCPEFTVKHALTTTLELTDSSNGMCTPEYSVVLNKSRYTVYLFDASKELAGYDVGCKVKVNFADGASSLLNLQVNED